MLQSEPIERRWVNKFPPILYYVRICTYLYRKNHLAQHIRFRNMSNTFYFAVFHNLNSLFHIKAHITS